MELAELIVVRKKDQLIVNGVSLPVNTEVTCAVEPRGYGRIAEYIIRPGEYVDDVCYRIILTHDHCTIQGTCYGRTFFGFETSVSYNDNLDDDDYSLDDDRDDRRDVGGIIIERTLSTTTREL